MARKDIEVLENRTILESKTESKFLQHHLHKRLKDVPLREIVQYFVGDYSSIVWLYSNKDRIYINSKWWVNLLLIKQVGYFLSIHIILYPLYICFEIYFLKEWSPLSQQN